MEPDTEPSIREFKTQLQNREEAAKKLLQSIKPGMSVREVTALLGAPSGVVWQYVLFYSSSMTVRFSTDSKVVGVVSDLTGEATLQTRAGRDQKDVAAASSQFKAQTYSRQEPAKILIPLIEAGVGLSEVAELLGPPDAKYWDYTLVSSGTASLRVGFDPDDNVTTATIATQ